MQFSIVQKMQIRAHVLMVALATILALAASLFATSSTALAQTRISTSTSPSSSCPQPPTNVDLTTLSDSQLDLYGLPRKPVEVGRISKWQEVLKHVKHRLCGDGTPINKQHHQTNLTASNSVTTHQVTPNTTAINSSIYAGNFGINGGSSENANTSLPQAAGAGVKVTV